MTNNTPNYPYGQRGCGGGLMAPLILITLGTLFLLGQFTPYRFGRTWPILLIVIGLARVLNGSFPRLRRWPGVTRASDATIQQPGSDLSTTASLPPADTEPSAGPREPGAEESGINHV